MPLTVVCNLLLQAGRLPALCHAIGGAAERMDGL